MPLTYHEEQGKMQPRDRPVIEVTPAMIRAGVARLGDLLQAETSSAYVVAEVFEAMALVQGRNASEGTATA